MSTGSDKKHEKPEKEIQERNRKDYHAAKPIPDGCYESGTTSDMLREASAGSASLSTDLQGNGYPRRAKFDDQKE